MTSEEIILEIKSIGFTSFVPLRHDQKDGKNRFTWFHPIENYKDWFTVILIEENSCFKIERLDNPFGETFEDTDVVGLIQYIKGKVFNHLAETET